MSSNPIDAAESGLAPRMLVGWHAIRDVVSDGKWHTYRELVDAAVATGLAPRSGSNLIRGGATHVPPLLERRNRLGQWQARSVPTA